MKRLLSILALVLAPIVCSAQIIVVKAGADGKVYEPAVLTLTTPVLTTPVITGGISIAGTILPATNDGAALGSASNSYSDLYLASGAVINYNNGNVVLTHSAGVLTLGTGNLIITTAGSAAGSVVTNTGSQTLTNKTLNGAIVRPSIGDIPGDTALTLISGIGVITKATAAAITIAAPSSQDGTRITIMSNTDAAHVLTFTGGTLLDGTAGANTTATFAAFKGASITFVAYGSTWLVESINAVTVAP